MAEETATPASLEADLTSALASQVETANAPALQEAPGADSITTEQIQQTPEPWYHRLGVKDAENEDAALERLQRERAAGYQAYQQYQYEAQQRQQLQAQLAAIQQAQQSQQPAVQAKPAEQPKKPWEPVPFDETWLSWIDPATKQFRENTPYQVVIDYQKYARAQQDFINKMFTKPDEVLAPYIAEHAKGLVTPLQEKLDALTAQLEHQRQQQEIQSLLNPYRDQLFVVDQHGQVQRDQFGNPVMTPAGQNFGQYTAVAQQMGLTDPRHQAAFALLAAKVAQLEAQQQQPAAQPTPQTQRAQADAAIYQNGKANGTTRIGNRGNTINASTKPESPLQNEHTSLEDLLRNDYRKLAAQYGG
jgi:hypothetical protein